MGTVFKQTVTKPLPAGAEIIVRKGERFAHWTRRGKTLTAPVTIGRDGSERIVVEASKYYARYRDHTGAVVVRPTGCRDKQAAEQLLAKWEREGERIKAGVMTPAESEMSQLQRLPLAQHFDAYLAHLEAAGASEMHRDNVRRQLNRLADECGFSLLGDLDRTRLESWLAGLTRQGMGARTRNTYLAAGVAFCNWCAMPEVKRLASNPFAKIRKANEEADRRRRRRSLTEDELTRLLPVARQRPLLDMMTIRRGKRKGQAVGKLRDETRRRLELLGWERTLIYKAMVLSGLRRGELASLTVGQLNLDGPAAFAELEAADEKNREGSAIALRADLAADLRDWLAAKLASLQEEARQAGEPIPLRLPPATPVFTVPRELVKILNRDLKLAGIPKRDERGRTIDVHGLRHTFCTLLARGGVAPRTAQAAMRHSDPELTANHYTDPKLLDVHGALDALPELPLDAGPQTAAATGTCCPDLLQLPRKSEHADTRQSGIPCADEVLRPVQFVPEFVCNQYKPGQNVSIPDKTELTSPEKGEEQEVGVTSIPVNSKGPLTTAVKEPLESGRSDSNRRRPAWEASILPLNYARFLPFSS